MDLDKFENQIFFATVRITIPNLNGNTFSIGTGFLFNVQLNEERMATFLVSNKHVFGDSQNTIALALNKSKANIYEPALGETTNIEVVNFFGTLLCSS